MSVPICAETRSESVGTEEVASIDNDFHCVVMPHAVVEVSSGVSGRIQNIHVDVGDWVGRDQVVAALESGVERANLALADARANLEAEVGLRKTRLSFDRRRRERTQALHQRKVASTHEKEEAERDAAMALWQLRQANDNLALARLERTRAEEVLKLRTIRAPISGVVTERFKWPGEFVEEEPILRVAKLDPLRVEVIVPVALHQALHRNMVAEVLPETTPDEPRQGRVQVIDPMADPASGTFRVRVELPNPDHSLLGGIKCTARFIAPEPAS
ncbi:MAG: efflux RND transporter periplasmic adaptor subunit, partial [Pseudomonadota bacterium]